MTPEVFQHLVDLAALELSPGEAEYLRAELNLQLKSIAQLAAVEIPAGTPTTTHGIPFTDDRRQALRADDIRPAVEADDILSQAPEREGRYLVVPDVPPAQLE
jgi:aspartyl/glutamyl-tRNA(Asn/Gln) amidotransferase C subunit